MDVLVIGTGGLAREFSGFFSDQVNIIGFSSSDPDEFNKFGLSGRYFSEDISPEVVGTQYCVVAIGSPAIKRKVAKALKQAGFIFPNLVHPTAVSMSNFDSNHEGVIVSPNCVIGADVVFGKHVYLNFMVGVGHDTTFGNHVQVNPGAQIGGASNIENGVLIGSGATVRHGLRVRECSTVGSGAVVLTSVRGGLTVVGNPAKRLKLPNFNS